MSSTPKSGRVGDRRAVSQPAQHLARRRGRIDPRRLDRRRAWGSRAGRSAARSTWTSSCRSLSSLFGETEFFEHGNLSLFFLQPTVDEERVRCLAHREPGDRQARLSMENEQRRPDRGRHGVVRRGRHRHRGAPAPGQAAPEHRSADPRRPDAGRRGHRRHRGAMTSAGRADPVGDHRAAAGLPRRRAVGRRGRPDVAHRPLDHRPAARAQAAAAIDATGLYGALEIQYHDGPLFAGRDYLARGAGRGADREPEDREHVVDVSRTASRSTGADVVTRAAVPAVHEGVVAAVGPAAVALSRRTSRGVDALALGASGL